MLRKRIGCALLQEVTLLKAQDVRFSIPAREDSDWDYARNKRVFLRKGLLEWSCSVFSSSVRLWDMSLVGPNRDSPYEGLTYCLNQTSYRFLDGLLFSRVNENLVPAQVEVFSNKARYVYSSSGGLFKAELNTADIKDLGPVLILSVNGKCTLAPLVDIRSVYEKTNLNDIIVDCQKDCVEIRGKEASLIMFGLQNFEKATTTLSWHYKYGDGFRKKENGLISFKGADREVLAVGYGIAHQHVLIKPCEKGAERETAKTLSKVDPSSVIEKEDERLDRILDSARIDTGMELTDVALAGRILTLTSFGLPVNGTVIPEAGSWWFRNLWARDALEGIFWNIETYVKILGMKEFVRSTLRFLLSTLKLTKAGFLPAVMTPNPAGVSADGTILLFSAIAKFSDVTGEKKLFLKARGILMNLAVTLQNNSMDVEGGPPVLGENCLLACAPNQSWTDSVKHVSVGYASYPGFPSRIPDEWIIKDIGRIGPEKARGRALSAKFLLPEINALWIKVLEKYEIGNLLPDAETNFRKIFWNGNFINNLVSMEGNRDPTVTSMGVVTLSLLKHLFNQNEIDRAWSIVKERILIRRLPLSFGSSPVPFGILVKDSAKRIYYDDDEYHEAVAWPRDMPYLLELAKTAGEPDLRNLLLNVLDESLSEGALFYTGELYSLPEGGNPNRNSPLSDNPVPVKNQIQYWSHWCDPFLDFGLLTQKYEINSRK